MDERKIKLLFSITKKDLEVQTFRSGGKGGQNQNKRSTGVRILHKASGAKGECRNYRTQLQNKKEALRRLAKDKWFVLWISRKTWELSTQKTIEEIVEEQMKPKNLKIEYKDEKGKWFSEGGDA